MISVKGGQMKRKIFYLLNFLIFLFLTGCSRNEQQVAQASEVKVLLPNNEQKEERIVSSFADKLGIERLKNPNKEPSLHEYGYKFFK